MFAVTSNSFQRYLIAASTSLALIAAVGCTDDTATLRRIQTKRQVALQESTRQDHLGETVALLGQYVSLNEQKARQQITYHLNQWNNQRPEADKQKQAAQTPPKIAETLTDIVEEAKLNEVILHDAFTPSDVPLLRDAYLFNKVWSWIDSPGRDDPLFASWLKTLRDDPPGEMSDADIDRLQTAMRLFDWTVRNIALEPDQALVPPNMPQPNLPPGISFEGPGYRQTDFQTLWRGRGDWLQRSGVFTSLLTQAGIPCAVLATQSADTGQRTPWSVGVLIGDQIYLFQPQIGLPIPGPDQVGIATLAEARKDASVMRRLDVAGFFDFPLSRTDIQQSVALLNIRAETISPRMKALQSSLTGDRRMTLWIDTDDWSKRLDDVSGIAGVRAWLIPTISEMYAVVLDMLAERDPLFSFWHRSRNAILENEDASGNNLAKGRWQHLIGHFADDDIEGQQGARTYYLEQRAPEFEIDDLRINVELQKQYGIRRGLGMSPEDYNRQLNQVQGFMRLGKRTATYWLALVQYDDGRYETANNWLTKRVLDEEQLSHWQDAAIYNAARSEELEGDVEAAIERLKTDGPVYGHGNRLRARLLGK
ncbi:hypothetical protein SAMN06265222_10440 [Neorhodopirellula lusitana]|uniref:Secreted protein n=1 Tax=Neorhodopirellula lusitana TaxID=445327 RepID=A0ABY1Q0G5_9BACT|nr:hypothetical protein SAMN06265222_10440 [Neorhodopirellula lusitana]